VLSARSENEANWQLVKEALVIVTLLVRHKRTKVTLRRCNAEIAAF
jgi:Fe2+ transport system protein FeoA